MLTRRKIIHVKDMFATYHFKHNFPLSPLITYTNILTILSVCL